MRQWRSLPTAVRDELEENVLDRGSGEGGRPAAAAADGNEPPIALTAVP